MIWVVIIVLVLAAFLAVFLPEFQKAQVLQQEKQQLEQQVREEDREHQRLDGRLEALRSDSRAVENTARDRLKLAKPDETIFRFPPDNSGSPATQPAPPAAGTSKRGNP